MIRHLFLVLTIGFPIFAQADSLPECSVKFESTEYNDDGFVLRVGDEIKGYPVTNYHDESFTALKDLFTYRKHLAKSGVCKMPDEVPQGSVCNFKLGASNDMDLYINDKRVQGADFLSHDDSSLSAVNALARTLVNEGLCRLQNAQERPTCTVHKDFHGGYYAITTPLVEGQQWRGQFMKRQFSWQIGSGEQTREAINAQMDRSIEYWAVPLVFSGACRKVINTEHQSF